MNHARCLKILEYDIELLLLPKVCHEKTPPLSTSWKGNLSKCEHQTELLQRSMVVSFQQRVSLPGGLGLSSWAGIQHHLHNDNPGVECLRGGGSLGGFGCDVSILGRLIHIQTEICELGYVLGCPGEQFSLCMPNIALYFYQHVSFLGHSQSKERIFKWTNNTHLR